MKYNYRMELPKAQSYFIDEYKDEHIKFNRSRRKRARWLIDNDIAHRAFQSKLNTLPEFLRDKYEKTGPKMLLDFYIYDGGDEIGIRYGSPNPNVLPDLEVDLIIGETLGQHFPPDKVSEVDTIRNLVALMQIKNNAMDQFNLHEAQLLSDPMARMAIDGLRKSSKNFLGRKPEPKS